jgi:hypothetical protein
LPLAPVYSIVSVAERKFSSEYDAAEWQWLKIGVYINKMGTYLLWIQKENEEFLFSSFRAIWIRIRNEYRN